MFPTWHATSHHSVGPLDATLLLCITLICKTKLRMVYQSSTAKYVQTTWLSNPSWRKIPLTNPCKKNCLRVWGTSLNCHNAEQLSLKESLFTDAHTEHAAQARLLRHCHPHTLLFSVGGIWDQGPLGQPPQRLHLVKVALVELEVMTQVTTTETVRIYRY